jgi:hypothetical protein
MKQFVSLDGGETYVAVKDGVRVRYEELELPGEDDQGHLLVNCTHEGLILDVWTDPVDDATPTNVGTSSETVDEIVERLIEDNS